MKAKRKPATKAKPLAKGKLATVKSWAASDFKPWTRNKDMEPGELIPSNDVLVSCAVPARLAFAVMLRTKDELSKMFKKISPEAADEMMDSIEEAEKKLRQIADMLDSARCRLIVSASAYAVSAMAKEQPQRRPA